jgi:hypothetical protein
MGFVSVAFRLQKCPVLVRIFLNYTCILPVLYLKDCSKVA